MNAPLRRVAVACLVLFVALLVNANVVQAFQAGSLRTDPRNARQVVDAYSRPRGLILVDGQPVAESVATSDRLKYRRTYPQGPLYADVTGYQSLPALFGNAGIEKSYEAQLSGDDPRLFVRKISDFVTGRSPKGADVSLTLRSSVQQAAAQALGSQRGAVVALDPATGAILALVTSPTYDPNPLASHDVTAAQQAFTGYARDSSMPLLNRGAAQTYHPGSTFKVVDSAAALGTGQYTPDTQVASPTSFVLPDTRTTFGNFGGESCGGDMISLLQALTISCNTAFAKLGLALGAPALRSQADRLGFDAPLDGFPLRLAQSVFPTELNRPQLALSSIGQFDVRATPLAMAMVAAAVANHGTLMTPYVVSQVTAPDLSVLDKTEPKRYGVGPAMSRQTADQLTTMMESVVTNGTGTGAQIPGVTVAGKTGTADTGTKGAKPDAWFIAFAGPAGAEAKVAVAVIVEGAGNDSSDRTGGAVSAPIARQVIQAALAAPPPGPAVPAGTASPTPTASGG